MTEPEREIGTIKNKNNAVDWYPDDASFVERHGLREKLVLSHYESYEGLGAAGVTDPLYLSNGDIVLFVESVTPVPEREPLHIPGGLTTPGNPAYEAHTAVALLFSEDGFLMGHSSGATRTDKERFSIDTFAFNIELADLLPNDIADIIRYIHRNDRDKGLKIDEAYEGRGKAKEVLMLLLTYVQNKGVKTVEVGTDSTMRVDEATKEVSSFYKRTGAIGPRNDSGGWEYDVDVTIQKYSTLLAELITQDTMS